MFLKNKSTNTCVVINTTRGKVGIRPGEVVDIRYQILPPVSKSLVQVQEEEYLSFCEAKKGVIDTIIESKAEPIQKARPVVEEKLEDLERVEDEVVEEIQDTGILGFVNSLLEQKEANVEDSEALLVEETTAENEIARLEQQIDDLKQAWAVAKQANKKAKLAKEIKELQKQLKKIK
jgi:hypothetical protein